MNVHTIFTQQQICMGPTQNVECLRLRVIAVRREVAMAGRHRACQAVYRLKSDAVVRTQRWSQVGLTRVLFHAARVGDLYTCSCLSKIVFYLITLYTLYSLTTHTLGHL